jgi:diguanylate cyclase (GGDEF)-like protein
MTFKVYGQGDGRRREMARSTAVLFAAASAITAIGLVLPHDRRVDQGGLLVVVAVAGVVALVLAAGRERVPDRAYPLLAVLGTVLVSLGLFFNGERHGGPVGSDEMYYLWVVLWAAYYFTRRVLAVQVAIVLAADAITLAFIHPGNAGTSRFISVSGLCVGAAIVVRLLSERAERLVSELRRAALTDPLTGLANRRGFEGAFALEAARAARTGRPFSLLVLDLDRFKRLNDEQGHKAGDRALADVAAILSAHTREIDTAARTGGDEFALLLSDTDASGVKQMQRRLQVVIDEHARAFGWPAGVSLGIGVSDSDGSDIDALMRHADMRLYAAKRANHARTDYPPMSKAG